MTSEQRERHKAENKRWYEKNRARERAKQKARIAANRVMFLARRRELYALRKLELQASARARYAADPEQIRAKNRRNRALRLDVFRERDKVYARKWQQKNYIHFRACSNRSQQKRRAQKRAAFIEAVDPLVVFRRDSGICGICHRQIPMTMSNLRTSVAIYRSKPRFLKGNFPCFSGRSWWWEGDKRGRFACGE